MLWSINKKLSNSNLVAQLEVLSWVWLIKFMSIKFHFGLGVTNLGHSRRDLDQPLTACLKNINLLPLESIYCWSIYSNFRDLCYRLYITWNLELQILQGQEALEVLLSHSSLSSAAHFSPPVSDDMKVLNRKIGMIVKPRRKGECSL
jgi:hypothetical protein